ncbi:hypothetical protein ACFLZS_00920 [Patescibacteria group bacterium]
MIADSLRFLELKGLAQKWEGLKFFIKCGLVTLLIFFLGSIILTVLLLTGLLNFGPSWNMWQEGLYILFCYLGACLLLLGFYIILKLISWGDVSAEELEEMSDEDREQLRQYQETNDILIPPYNLL